MLNTQRETTTTQLQDAQYLATRDSWQHVSNHVFTTFDMFNIKVKLWQKLKPARVAPGHSRARLNIRQRDMIRQYKELDTN